MTDIEHYIKSRDIPPEELAEAVSQYLDIFNKVWLPVLFDCTTSGQAKEAVLGYHMRRQGG